MTFARKIFFSKNLGDRGHMPLLHPTPSPTPMGYLEKWIALDRFRVRTNIIVVVMIMIADTAVRTTSW